MMPNFKPRLGTKFQAQTAPVSDGQFIVATDSRELFYDNGTELPALIYEMTPKTKEIRNGLPYPEEYRKICREGANLHRIKNHFIRKWRRK